MANNNQSKYEPKKLTQKELEEKEAKKERIVKLSLKIFAIVALVAIVAGIVIGIVVSVNRNKSTTFNYLEEDLKKYISVDLTKLRDFAVENKADPVTDATVRNELLKLLNTYKPSDALGEGKRYNNKPVAPGDDAYIFYRGYTLDEDGNKIDFTGGSNLAPNENDSNITADYYELYSKNFNEYKNYIKSLTIGSGSFIAGFELGIVDAFYSESGEYKGKLPSDFQKYLGYVETEKTVVEDGDYITISFTKHNKTTGTTDDKLTLVSIDLSNKEKLDETYGLDGFADKFIGATKGADLGTITGATLNDESIEYRDVKVSMIHNRTTSTDLIELSYLEDGSNDRKTVTVDLSNTNLDETYGAGFRAFLTRKPIAQEIGDFIKKGEGDETDTLYSKVIVERVFHFEEGKEPLTISVKFPGTYGSEELAGKEAKFDVYIIGVKKYYDVENDGFPLFDDDFVTNELKAKAEDVADYEGDGIAEKYIAKIRAELEEEYEVSVNDLIEAELWNVLKEASTVKKYPESEIDYYYNMYYAQLYQQYQQYQQYYGSSYTFDMFAEAQGISTKDKSWQVYLAEQAERTVGEKLAFYYVAKEEKLLPDEATLEVLSKEFYDESFADFLDNYSYNSENDENQEKYNQYKEEFEAQYTEEAIRESAQFKYAMEKLYGYAKLNPER